MNTEGKSQGYSSLQTRASALQVSCVNYRHLIVLNSTDLQASHAWYCYVLRSHGLGAGGLNSRTRGHIVERWSNNGAVDNNIFILQNWLDIRMYVCITAFSQRTINEWNKLSGTA